MDDRALIGDWDLGWGREFIIQSSSDGPVLRFPESPPGFEARLVPTAEGVFRIEGGAYPGAELRVDGPGRLTVGGVISVTRLERAAQPPPGGGLVAPPLDLDDREVDRCEWLWAMVDHPSRTVELELDGIVPHRFVQWLTAHELVIFHGSNAAGIEKLAPVRRSTGLNDATGRGNRGAVYGTHDGLWAMFFSVIDRHRLEGSIRNGVDTHWSETGDRLDLYHFSIHQGLLAGRPFTTGALYLLPRDRFSRLPLYREGPPSAEWACEEPVRPLARIRVRPEDFPFLDRIGGHDDGEVIEFEELVDRVYDAAISARELNGGIEIITTADREEVVRMVELSRRFYPDVKPTLADDPRGSRLTMTGPPGFRQRLRSRFSEMLES